jgi:putative membrane protein
LYGCKGDDAVQAAGENPDGANLPPEKDFMVKAAQAHLAEIGMARLARLRSKDGGVKRYAAAVLKDHTAALENLNKLMAEKDVPEPKMISAQSGQDMARAWQLSGPEFDREFANMMVSDHQKALELFRNTSYAAHDTDIQDYVDELIPKLDKHLMNAQEMQSKLFSGRAR